MVSNKKGGVNAIFFVVVIILILIAWGTMTLLANFALKEVNQAFQEDPIADNYSKQNLQSTTTNYPKTMDSAFLVIFVLGWVGLIIGSLNSLEHPIFFIIALIFIACLLFIGAVLSNFYEELASSEDLISSAADFPVTYFITGKLPLVILAIVGSIIITMYARERL